LDIVSIYAGSPVNCKRDYSMLDKAGDLSRKGDVMGIRTPNINDRRVQRTRKLLHEALISLILERGYDAVTIRDVVQRAGVGRSTFYTHFGDLEELLLSQTDGHWLREFAARGHSGRKLLGFTRPFLEHANEQRRVWRALVGKKGGVAIQKRFRESLVQLLRKEVVQVVGKQRTEITEVLVRYIAGAFTEILFWWLDSPASLSPADVDEMFHRLTAGALGAIQPPRR
jgi:AcrR family transcriptional regulator